MAFPKIVVLTLALAAGESAGPGLAKQPDVDPDEKILRDKGILPDGLLKYFLDRTLSPAEEKKIGELVRQLGSDVFREREQATKALVARGAVVLPFLRETLQSEAELEVKRRAQSCLKKIEVAIQPEVTAAALRLLAKRRTEGTAEALLRFVPFAEPEGVDEDVLATLVELAKGKRIDPVLIAALKDGKAGRRAAAAYALGRLPEQKFRTLVRPLLEDNDPMVRLRAAQGFLAGLDKIAVPALIALLGESAEASARAEDLLYSLAGENSPSAVMNDPKKWRSDWNAWWKKHENIDLAKLSERPPFVGLALIPEMHAGKVYECDKKGKPRWTIAGLTLPIDAQALPGGRVLIAELTGNRVTERDQAGKILWEKKISTPIACMRLVNGNTFIGTNHALYVFSKDKDAKELFTYKPEPGYYIHSVQRQLNGHTVMVSMAGEVREIDAKGNVLRKVPLQKLAGGGNWCGVESAPGNRYLVVRSGHVYEIDYEGKSHWDHGLPGACYASRLPNGTTLIVGTNRVVEVDRLKNIVWEQKIGASLWRAHMR